ncbi:MAG: ABC transporter ATP-binding protein [Clostridiales bacterium]|jgi:putative ABC transport system ATP-binding protein|nr:ABC transporter ATP-binding protein [Clostridiales bacterium]
MEFIRLNQVSKIYGGGENRVAALDGVSLTLSPGEFAVILGSSGAGKTTLLNIIGGMDRLSEGTYAVDGENVHEFDNKRLAQFRRRRIGFVFQFYNLMPNLTALENVQLAQSVADRPMDAREALELVGLSRRLKNFPAQLSGGEQQRVSIARAFVKNPALLLCDEPTGALDSKTGAAILGVLQDICRRQNRTTVIVTHNAKIAEIASRVIRIQDGRIAADRQNERPKAVSEIEW